MQRLMDTGHHVMTTILIIRPFFITWVTPLRQQNRRTITWSILSSGDWRQPSGDHLRQAWLKIQPLLRILQLSSVPPQSLTSLLDQSDVMMHIFVLLRATDGVLPSKTVISIKQKYIILIINTQMLWVIYTLVGTANSNLTCDDEINNLSDLIMCSRRWINDEYH